MMRNVAVGACVATLTLCLPLATGPVALAQLPGGLDPAQIKEMLPSQVSVAAGESTTVDVGVPVDVNYSADGWVVSSSGTTVTVQAPNTPGATANVPANALGYSATITLVAVGGSESPDVAPDGEAEQAETSKPEEDGGNTSTGSDTGSVTGSDADAKQQDGAQVTHPPREAAAPVDTTAAKTFYFDGEIHGNTLVVTVPLTRAADLAKYARTDREGAKLRYLDVNGRVIQGVKRDVDIAKRTLTLTYPEGETPDNPFIMEVVRDDSVAEFIAVITAKNAPVEQAEASASEGDDAAEQSTNPYADVAKQSQGAEPDSANGNGIPVPLIVGGVGLLVLLALVFTVLRRRGTGRA